MRPLGVAAHTPGAATARHRAMLCAMLWRSGGRPAVLRSRLRLRCVVAPAKARPRRLPLLCRRRLKPLSNLLSLQLHAREIRGSLPPALFRCLNRLQHLAISGAPSWPSCCGPPLRLRAQQSCARLPHPCPARLPLSRRAPCPGPARPLPVQPSAACPRRWWRSCRGCRAWSFMVLAWTWRRRRLRPPCSSSRAWPSACTASAARSGSRRRRREAAAARGGAAAAPPPRPPPAARCSAGRTTPSGGSCRSWRACSSCGWAQSCPRRAAAAAASGAPPSCPTMCWRGRCQTASWTAGEPRRQPGAGEAGSRGARPGQRGCCHQGVPARAGGLRGCLPVAAPLSIPDQPPCWRRRAAHPCPLHPPSLPPRPPACSALTHLVLPVALTALPDLVPGQLAGLAALDLTHSIVEGLPPSWCRQLQARARARAGGAAGRRGGARIARPPRQLAACPSFRTCAPIACAARCCCCAQP